MKENAARFKLAYSSLMLNLELSDNLRRVGEGRLSHDVLHSQKQLSKQPEVQEIFNLFQNSQHKKFQHKSLQTNG